MSLINKLPRRVRHETRLRQLTVTKVDRITPRMVRVTLAGEQLRGFVSQGYDDHVKLFFPPPGRPIVVPIVGDNGLEFPRDAVRPEMRDYTPRRFDPAGLTLDVDFVLHGDGPASAWAEQAEVGQTLLIGGPRGSMIIPDAFDWYLLTGDETALPAIGRRLEELPEASRALAVIEVATPEEEQGLAAGANVEVVWAHRNGMPAGTGDALLRALRAASFPEGEPFAFVAAEATIAKSIRQYLLEDRGLSSDWLKAAGYWVLGEADAHDAH